MKNLKQPSLTVGFLTRSSPGCLGSFSASSFLSGGCRKPGHFLMESRRRRFRFTVWIGIRENRLVLSFLWNDAGLARRCPDGIGHFLERPVWQLAKDYCDPTRTESNPDGRGE